MTRSARGATENPGRNVAQRSGLNRRIPEQGWGAVKHALEYKSARAERTYILVTPVGPAATASRTCPECGTVDAENRRTQTGTRRIACGYEAHAADNATENIRRRAVTSPGRAECLSAREPSRAAGNPTECKRLRISSGETGSRPCSHEP